MDVLGSETLFGWTEMTKNETNIETTLSKLAVEHGHLAASLYHLAVAYISLAPCAISSSPSPQACDSQKADFSSQHRFITVD